MMIWFGHVSLEDGLIQICGILLQAYSRYLNMLQENSILCKQQHFLGTTWERYPLLQVNCLFGMIQYIFDALIYFSNALKYHT